MDVEVEMEEGAASTEVLMSDVVVGVDRVADTTQTSTQIGTEQTAMTLGTFPDSEVGDGQLPGYFHGVDLSVLPISMWMAAGADKYQLAHQRHETVYIAKSTISDSMWGLFSGRDHPALEGDTMCDYHGVRYKYNVLTAKEKPMTGNDYVW